jgi:hypothetical protein
MANRNQEITKAAFPWAGPAKAANSSDGDPTLMGIDPEFALRKAIEKAAPGIAAKEMDLAQGANKIFRESHPSAGQRGATKLDQTNRNLETGASTILTMAGAPSYEKMNDAQKVAVRSKCAQFHKSQGHSSCAYCLGTSYEVACGVRGDTLSRNTNSPDFGKSANHSRDVVPEPFKQYRKV